MSREIAEKIINNPNGYTDESLLLANAYIGLMDVFREDAERHEELMKVKIQEIKDLKREKLILGSMDYGYNKAIDEVVAILSASVTGDGR